MRDTLSLHGVLIVLASEKLESVYYVIELRLRGGIKRDRGQETQTPDPGLRREVLGINKACWLLLFLSAGALKNLRRFRAENTLFAEDALGSVSAWDEGVVRSDAGRDMRTYS
jgi:hypothetical protein